MRVIENAVEKLLAKDFDGKFWDYLVMGLFFNEYGYRMSKKELEDFAKEHVRCECDSELEQLIFYVNDVPFLIQLWRTIEFDFIYNNEKRTTKEVCITYDYL